LVEGHPVRKVRKENKWGQEEAQNPKAKREADLCEENGLEQL